MSIEGISKLNDLVKEVNANLNTNVSLSDALYFATNALDLDLTKVVMLTMPGTPAYINNVSYYLVNKTALMENINTYLNKYNEPLDESHFLVVQGTSKDTSRESLTATDIEKSSPTSAGCTVQKKIMPEAETRAALPAQIPRPHRLNRPILPNRPFRTGRTTPKTRRMLRIPPPPSFPS